MVVMPFYLGQLIGTILWCGTIFCFCFDFISRQKLNENWALLVVFSDTEDEMARSMILTVRSESVISPLE